MILLALLLAGADAAEAEAPFEPSAETFADAAACEARLAGIVAEERKAADAAEGPYPIADGDVRIHSVRAEGAGHRIREWRCLDAVLSSRSWTHSMADEEAPATLESMAANAEWLKKDRPKQQQ